MLAIMLLLIVAASVSAKKKSFPQGIRIKDSILEEPNGDIVVLGFDEWGYNYQAHMFKGPYCYHDRHYSQEEPDWNDNELYCNIKLRMKWNDAWLSNQDQDGDGKLDRHYGFESYIGSDAELRVNMWGAYETNGEMCYWESFSNVVAVPEYAYLENGRWYSADGTEIGQYESDELALAENTYTNSCLP